MRSSAMARRPQGDFHEALNFAGVFQVPVIFVCQNNQWAISDPALRQTRSRPWRKRPSLTACRGSRWTATTSWRSTRRPGSGGRARAGGGPTLIECVTYRLTVHTTADDPKRYRPDAEVEEWRHRDPITRFESYLAGGAPGRRGCRGRRGVGAEEIQTAVDRARRQMKHLGDPLLMFEHAYAEMPPHPEGAARGGHPVRGQPKEEDEHGKMTMVQALNLALRQEMEHDDRVVVLGEDVGLDGGVFRVTEGLIERFGERARDRHPARRVRHRRHVHRHGRTGCEPVCEIQFSGFSYHALHQIENHAARLRSRSHGRFHVPMVIRVPYGGGVRALEHHSESREAIWAHMPGSRS